MPRRRPLDGAVSSSLPSNATSTKDAGYPRQTQPPGPPSSTTAAANSEAAGTGRVSRELKEALGLAERKAGILAKQADDDIADLAADAGNAKPQSDTPHGGQPNEVDNGATPATPAVTAAASQAAPGAAVPEDAPTSAPATASPVPGESVQNEGRVSQEDATAGGEAEGGEEDPWFDDFFAKTKTAAEAKAEQEEHERKKAQAKKQAQGQSALEARLQAQKQAAEAKKKLELEKKAKKKQSDAAAKCAATKVNGQDHKPAAAKPEVEREAATSHELVVQRDRDKDIIVNRSKACWDSTWSHPCAGERRADGSAVFCHPCDAWVSVCEPYDHRDFELHCEKVGHYGWID